MTGMLDDRVIAQKAWEIRSRLGFSCVCAPDMFAVLDSLREKALSFDYEIVPSRQINGDEARMDETHGLLLISETTEYRLRCGDGRARFTVAHEIGHFMLGHRGISHRTSDKSSVYLTANDRIKEREADAFASYFLVPQQLASGVVSPQEIAERFQVSATAAEFAYGRIERSGEASSPIRRQPPKGVIDFLSEARRRGRPISSLPTEE